MPEINLALILRNLSSTLLVHLVMAYSEQILPKEVFYLPSGMMEIFVLVFSPMR